MDKDIRVRVRFVTKDASIRVNEAPIAVPTQLGRHGLSEVINHLRGLASKKTEDGEQKKKDQEEGGYDFLIENQLLRCSLDKFLVATGLSTELTVTIEYFRALDAPSEGPKSSSNDTWISGLAGCGHGKMAAGCYDGVIRCYKIAGGKNVKEMGRCSAHDGPIKGLVANQDGWIATGGKDRIIKTWKLQGDGGGARQLESWTGHENSVECMALREGDDGEKQVLSGDWGGMVMLWKSRQGEGEEAANNVQGGGGGGAAKKKRKGQSGEEAPVPIEKTPKTQFKAHAQCVSGVCFDPTPGIGGKVFTSSWDHSIKVWDLERQDCVQTLNGSKVVASLSISSCSPSSSLSCQVASGHPDGRLRIWDLRAGGEGGNDNGETVAMAKKVMAPCGSWISGVEWHPTLPSILASISHDGQLRLWDTRATKPLYSISAHEGKALALSFDDEGQKIYTGGEDGVVRCFDMSAAVQQ